MLQYALMKHDIPLHSIHLVIFFTMSIMDSRLISSSKQKWTRRRGIYESCDRRTVGMRCCDGFTYGTIVGVSLIDQVVLGGARDEMNILINLNKHAFEDATCFITSRCVTWYYLISTMRLLRKRYFSHTTTLTPPSVTPGKSKQHVFPLGSWLHLVEFFY